MEERNQAIDYGIDFYAPQTILDPDGRSITVGANETSKFWLGMLMT